jgi:hypothetical protein
MADPVEDDLSHGLLAGGRFHGRLVIDGGGQALDRAQPVGRGREGYSERTRRRIGKGRDRHGRVDRHGVLRRDLTELQRLGLGRDAEARNAASGIGEARVGRGARRLEPGDAQARHQIEAGGRRQNGRGEPVLQLRDSGQERAAQDEFVRRHQSLRKGRALYCGRRSMASAGPFSRSLVAPKI